jgi:O-antigen ligase
MLLMSAYLLRIAHSATSLFCALVGTLIIIGTSIPVFKRSPQKVAPRVLGMGVLLAILEALFHISTWVILALGRDPTLTNRTFLWKTLLGMGTNPIIGAGYESFWSAERITYVRSVVGGGIQSHNGYIDTYLNLGIIGVFFFVALLWTFFRIIAKDMPADYSFNSLRLAFLVIFIFFNYSEGLFPRLGLLLAIFFFMIILVPKVRPGPPPGPAVEDASPA